MCHIVPDVSAQFFSYGSYEKQQELVTGVPAMYTSRRRLVLGMCFSLSSIY